MLFSWVVLGTLAWCLQGCCRENFVFAVRREKEVRVSLCFQSDVTGEIRIQGTAKVRLFTPRTILSSPFTLREVNSNLTAFSYQNPEILVALQALWGYPKIYGIFLDKEKRKLIILSSRNSSLEANITSPAA
jgi:hypothetical protein